MNWFRENKLISGILAVTVVAAAVLIYLIMGAKGAYEQSVTQYEQKSAELSRLRQLKPYPDDDNLAKLTSVRNEYRGQVNQMRGTLAAKKFPITEMSPEQFQDRLRARVSEISKMASENGVALPQGFYLGFPRYQNTPPNRAAIPRLAWEMKAIDLVVTSLIQSKVASIDTLIDRPLLPQETGGSAAAGEPARGSRNQKRGGRNAPEENAPGGKLVQSFPFTISFTGDQSRFRSVINQITNTKEQFMVVRTLKVTNQKTEGPPKIAVAAVGATPTAPAGSVDLIALTAQNGGASSEPALQFVLGAEKIQVVMTVDAIDFAAPAGGGKQASAR